MLPLHVTGGIYVSLRCARIRTVLCAVFLTSITAIAQTPDKNQAGPVPQAILDARKIFVSNAGADSGLFPEPFSGDPSRGYTQFYTALQATGHYELVADPSQADLVLELQLTAPNGPSRGSKVNGASDPVPMFRLVVYDRKSHYVLWAFTESIDVAFLQKTHDRNFDEALAAVLADFEGLTGKAQATPAQGPRSWPRR
jgi:hypothetical protein